MKPARVKRNSGQLRRSVIILMLAMLLTLLKMKSMVMRMAASCRNILRDPQTGWQPAVKQSGTADAGHVRKTLHQNHSDSPKPDLGQYQHHLSRTPSQNHRQRAAAPPSAHRLLGGPRRLPANARESAEIVVERNDGRLMADSQRSKVGVIDEVAARPNRPEEFCHHFGVP